MKNSNLTKYNLYFSHNKIKFTDSEFINAPIIKEKNTDNYFTKSQLEYYRTVYSKKVTTKEISIISVDPKKYVYIIINK